MGLNFDKNLKQYFLDQLTEINCSFYKNILAIHSTLTKSFFSKRRPCEVFTNNCNTYSSTKSTYSITKTKYGYSICFWHS